MAQEAEENANAFNNVEEHDVYHSCQDQESQRSGERVSSSDREEGKLVAQKVWPSQS